MREYTEETLRAAVEQHAGKHYDVLGEAACHEWYPVVDADGLLTGELVHCHDDADRFDITADEMAATMKNASD